MDEPHDAKSETTSEQYEAASTSELLSYLDLDAEFREKFFLLTGLKYDVNEDKIVEDTLNKPLIRSVEGRAWLLRTLKMYYSRSSTINDFDEKRIGMLMMNLRNYLWTTLGSDAQRERLGIDTWDIDEIIEQICVPAFKNMNRSMDGNELTAITKVVKSVEQVKHTSDFSQRRSPLSFLKRGRR